jgi:hypothetical protein
MRVSMAAFAATSPLEISYEARPLGNKFENTLF